MSERKTYYLFCGEIHTGGTPPMDLDSRLILHDHGGATCDKCITTTLKELNTLADQLAAVTAERDEAAQDRDVAWADIAVYRVQVKAATERAEKAEAERDAHNAARIRQIRTQQEWAEQRDEWLCEVLIRHGIDSYGTDKKPIRQMFKEHPEDQVISGVLSVLIRARDTHWAECEAWRAVASKMRREGKWINEPIEAREASDRARNPILEPPAQGGENPGAV